MGRATCLCVPQITTSASCGERPTPERAGAIPHRALCPRSFRIASSNSFIVYGLPIRRCTRHPPVLPCPAFWWSHMVMAGVCPQMLCVIPSWDRSSVCSPDRPHWRYLWNGVRCSPWWFQHSLVHAAFGPRGPFLEAFYDPPAHMHGAPSTLAFARHPARSVHHAGTPGCFNGHGLDQRALAQHAQQFIHRRGGTACSVYLRSRGCRYCRRFFQRPAPCSWFRSTR